MTTHHPKFSIHTALQLVGLTTEKLLPTMAFELLLLPASLGNGTSFCTLVFHFLH